MEDAYTLIVLTLLQICRAEISNPLPEWYAANLINDASYTPKPITEIFTTDLSFTPKEPIPQTTSSITTTPPSPTTTLLTTRESTTILQNEDETELIQQNIPFEIIQLSKPQQPIIFSQTARPFNADPKLFIIFNTAQGSTQQPTTNENKLPTESSTQIPETISQQTYSNAAVPVNVPMAFMNQVPMTDSFNIPQFSVPVAETTNLPPVKRVNLNPVITLRMKSPRGTITNIYLNPTTTRKPVTTRRRKPNQRRNNYDTCLKSCSDKKEPLCASPIGINPINPDRLKGFPSLCHMACHNSFRTNQVYDKVSDGRCGRLRTRIRPIDKDKLNREDLNKAQYTIVHNGAETLMEFSPLSA